MSNRTFAPFQAVFVSASPATGAASTSLMQLNRIQSYGLSDSFTREDVLQLGDYAPLSKEITTPPTVTLDLTYLMSNIRNESGLGFYVGGQTSGALTPILNGSQQEKNYYISFAPEGTAAIGFAGNKSVISVGNGVIGSYSVQGQVGQFPTASVQVQGLDLKFDSTSSNIDSPAVIASTAAPVTGITVTIPTATTGSAGISVVRPDGIRVTLSSNPFGIQAFCATSFNISANFSLTPQQCLGDRFPYSREMTFPIPITVALEANARDFAAGRLSTFLCNDINYDVEVNLYGPGCTGALGALAAGFKVTNAKYVERQIQTQVGAQNTTVSLNFEGQIGGPTAAAGTPNFYMSGSIV